MPIAEMIGLFLVGYGIWFTARGFGMYIRVGKDWWRPTSRKTRYPYPAAGILLGICFVILGMRFALNYAWPNASILGYIGGATFLVVLVIGIVQPRFLHPRWYGALEDRFGKKGMTRLRSSAFKVEAEEWREIVATELTFSRWVDRTMPSELPRQKRGYKRNE